MKKHTWSGWPGAYCLVCMAPDPAEVCIGEHDKLDYICVVCKEHWPQGMCEATGHHHVTIEVTCPDHPDTECI